MNEQEYNPILPESQESNAGTNLPQFDQPSKPIAPQEAAPAPESAASEPNRTAEPVAPPEVFSDSSAEPVIGLSPESGDTPQQEASQPVVSSDVPYETEFTAPSAHAYSPRSGPYGVQNEPEAYAYARPPHQPTQSPVGFSSVSGAYGVPQGSPFYGQSVGGYGPQGAPQPGVGQGGYAGGTGSYYPPIPPQRPLKRKNKGLTAFFIVLLCVVVVASSMTIAYYLGLRNGENGNSGSDDVSYSSSIDVQVQEKPAASSGENADGSYSVQSVVEQMKDSVVSITVYSPDGSSGSSATGVILSEDGYILTNDHIYKDIPNARFRITLNNGDEYTASFVAGDSRSDIAVLKMNDASGLQSATFGKSSQCQVGEQVVAIGNSAGLVDTVTVGYISALDRRISGTTSYTSKYIQTDTAINPGNSGGPLVNLYGQVIGINSSKIADVDSEGLCFAIPVDEALSIVENLLANGRVVGRAKLGITYTEISSVAAEINNCPTGLYIATISEDSDLYGKDIAQGDIITHVNGDVIASSSQILDVIENSKAGDTIVLTIYKSATGASVELSTRLVEYVGESSYTTSTVTSDPTTSMPNYFNYYDDGTNEDFLGPNIQSR